MAGRKKGPEKKKFLVRRPKPSHSSGQRDQKPDDATMELSGTEPRPNLDVSSSIPTLVSVSVTSAKPTNYAHQ